MANVKNANDILIGTGRLYLDGYDVGQLDGDLQFEHGKEYFEKKSGFPATTVKKVLTGETYTSKFALLEANLDTIRRLMPEYSEVTEAAGTGTATDEVVSIFEGSHSALAHGRISAITSVVTVDDSTSLVEGTDYYIDRLAGTIYRVGSSTAVTDGEDVKVTYDYETFEGSGIGFGGSGSSDKTFRVEFWHKRTDGRYRCIKLWKCQVDGNFSVTFKESEDSPIDVSLTALADSTKPAGQQLGVQMDLDATAAPDGGW
ncbi:hypothetical protein L2W58_08055 [Dethiosulfovibrio sp. F2B]|uniref:phage tail tube protein n=1 Tax=Dethiosulfovibrio faecalis TaxID=2720018 RepID=UPI001F2FE494|nr:hypothetical protein [Dethiosulfovibrio faecalis]MCF4151754.1 hypothetical protein [Dethiosulfovibrio faecalis]